MKCIAHLYLLLSYPNVSGLTKKYLITNNFMPDWPSGNIWGAGVGLPGNFIGWNLGLGGALGRLAMGL
jgi:hypothetical protein